MFVPGRAEKIGSLTLVLKATIHGSRGALRPMLTYRLTGTTEDSGSTATNPTSLTPLATP